MKAFYSKEKVSEEQGREWPRALSLYNITVHMIAAGVVDFHYASAPPPPSQLPLPPPAAPPAEPPPLPACPLGGG